MKAPTLRKIRNRGLRPIRYRSRNRVRHGFEVSRTNKYIVVRLIGDNKNRRIPIAESRFISDIGEPR